MNDIGRPSEDEGIIPLPLVIGVTGHRDLREEDREPLEAQVRRIFVELRSRYRSTPLLLLSALAEGADRLVARVALEQGVHLVVPLPLSQALYEKDFQTRASRDEFNKLLEQAEWHFKLPLLKGVSEEEVPEQGLTRNRQYAQAGAYIVLHCQILIALWDGRYSDEVGSTSQVVQFQLSGVPEPYAAARSSLDEPESGPVYQIVTPRAKNPVPIGKCFELRKLNPTSRIHDGASHERDSGGDWQDIISEQNGKKQNDHRIHDEAKQQFDRVLQSLDTFNRDAMGLGSSWTKKRGQSKAELFGEMDTTTLPPDLKVTLNRYADLYAIADALALKFKGRTVTTLSTLFWVAFIAVVFFNVFAHLGNYLVMPNLLQGNWGEWLRFLSLILYLAFLSLAYYIWYSRATRGHYKNKYLDYRALAEGLRVQFFWRLAGVPDTVATHYLRKQKSELDWIRNSIRVANLLCDANSSESPTDSSLDVLDRRNCLLLKQWVDEQATYFTRTTIEEHRNLEGNKRLVSVLLLAGIVLAGVLLILQVPPLLPPNGEWIKNVPLIDLLIIIISLVLVFAALREGYGDKMAYAEQFKQYQRMSHLYRLASQRLKDAQEKGKLQDVEEVILALGEEALVENGDWVILHRMRPIKVPRGG